MAGPFDNLSDDEFERLASAASPAPVPEPIAAADGMTDEEFEALASAPAAPAPAAPTGVEMLDAQGNSVFMPEGSELEAVARGLTPASDIREVERQAALQAEHGGLGSQTLAGLEGFGRGATMGLSDVAAESASGLAAVLGGPDVERVAGPALDAPVVDDNAFTRAYKEARADIQARREANPVTAGLAEVTGAVAPTLLSGGGSALASVAGAAPANLVNRAGMAAAGRVAGAAPGILRAAGAGAVGGAVEGGLAAGALAASEVAPEVIVDPGLAAEHILTATSEGALVGGVFGGIFGGAAKALTRGATKLDGVGESLATKAPDNTNAVPAGPATPESLDEITFNLEAKPAAITPEELAAVDTRGKYAKIVEQQQALEGKYDDSLQAETRAIRAEMDNILRGANKVDEFGGIAAKKRVNELASKVLSEDELAELSRKLEAAEADLRISSEQGDVRGAELASRDAAAIRGQLEDARIFADGASPSGVYDDFGKQYGVVRGRGANAQPIRREMSKMHVKARAVTQAIRDDLDAFAGKLTDAESKGLGAMKNHIAAVSEKIDEAFRAGDIGEAYSLLDQGVKGAMGRMRANMPEWSKNKIEELYPTVQKFLEDEAVWGSLARRQKAVNPHWANRIANSQDASWKQYTSVAGERAANQWDNLNLASDTAIKGLLSNIGDAGAARAEEVFRKNLRAIARDAVERAKAWGGEELQDEAERIVTGVAKIEQSLDSVARLRLDAIEGARAAQLSSTSDLAASAIGMISPRMAFAVQGSAVAKRKLIAAAAEAGSDVGSKVAKGAAKLVRLANRGAEAAAKIAPRAAAVALAASESGAVQQLISQKKLDRSVNEAQALMDPRSPQARDLFETAAAVERDEPELADSMVNLQLRRAQLIQSLLPKPMPGLFAPKPQLDPMRERKLQRTVSAAYYPERTLGRLADATATKDEIDTIKALYPGLYQQFVASVEREIGSTRKVPSREDQQRIHAMTGLVMRPSLEPSAIVQQQQVAMAATAAQEAKEAAQRSGGAPFKVDPERFLGKSDRILSQ